MTSMGFPVFAANAFPADKSFSQPLLGATFVAGLWAETVETIVNMPTERPVINHRCIFVSFMREPEIQCGRAASTCGFGKNGDDSGASPRYQIHAIREACFFERLTIEFHTRK